MRIAQFLQITVFLLVRRSVPNPLYKENLRKISIFRRFKTRTIETALFLLRVIMIIYQLVFL
jgi:hypothetical protein